MDDKYGIDGPLALKNVLAIDKLLATYDNMNGKSGSQIEDTKGSVKMLPSWFVKEAFSEQERWWSGRWLHSETRGSGPHRMASFGLDVDLDTSPLACATACGLPWLESSLLTIRSCDGQAKCWTYVGIARRSNYPG